MALKSHAVKARPPRAILRRPWYNQFMPSFRVQTPQRAYDAIVSRGSVSRLPEFLPARAGKIFVVTTNDVWAHHGALVEQGSARQKLHGLELPWRRIAQKNG